MENANWLAEAQMNILYGYSRFLATLQCRDSEVAEDFSAALK